MLAKVESRTTHGIKGYRVDVEVDVSGGIPGFFIVGLPKILLLCCNCDSQGQRAFIQSEIFILFWFSSLHNS